MRAIYETEIKRVGECAHEFESEKMLITFGENAPDELKDHCLSIEVNAVPEEIKAGQTLYFDDQAYRVTAVGSVVKQNLEGLGHITIKFDGSSVADVYGTLYVEEKPLPEVKTGTRIKIVEE